MSYTFSPTENMTSFMQGWLELRGRLVHTGESFRRQVSKVMIALHISLFFLFLLTCCFFFNFSLVVVLFLNRIS